MISKMPEEKYESKVVIPTDTVQLQGILYLPPKPKGLVIFAHGSGSGRFSPRNNFVARVLQGAGLATLLVDLLDESESLDRWKVFNIDLLSQRLLANVHWLREQEKTRTLLMSYFGASTGAGAALRAVVEEPHNITAIVSRGGRPDLAMEYLPRVQTPTLLIVGGEDVPVIFLNEKAYEYLRCPKELVIIPGATHLFEEPGTLEKVAELARDWFVKYFVPQT